MEFLTLQELLPRSITIIATVLLYFFVFFKIKDVVNSIFSQFL